MPRAAIDIGSNSLLLLIVGDSGEVICDLSRIVGLGKGLGDSGGFQEGRMQSALEVLEEFSRRANTAGVHPSQVMTAATSAARRASNAREFFERVSARCGLDVQIISGEREAELTWAGARDGLDLPSGTQGVVDLGGGSTEVVLGEGEQIRSMTSMEVGTVRLTEAVCGKAPETFTDSHRDQMLQLARSHVRHLRWPDPLVGLIGVAGTATTLAAAELGLHTWDARRVHGSWLSKEALQRWTVQLVGPGREARRAMVRASPERADTVLSGACILLEICAGSGAEGLLISVGGIRHGLVASGRVSNSPRNVS